MSDDNVEYFLYKFVLTNMRRFKAEEVEKESLTCYQTFVILYELANSLAYP